MRLSSSRRHIVLILAGIAMGALVASMTVLDSRASAEADETEMLSVVAAFEAAQASESTIPADSLSVVQDRLDTLATADDRPVADDEQSPVRVLPADVCDAIDKAHAERLATFCSKAYQMRHEEDVPLSDVVEAGLYNNPTAPLCVESRQKLLAEVMKKNDDGVAIVWVYLWFGDVTTKGYGGQSWRVHEYRLVKQDGDWRIDARSCLASSCSKKSGDDAATSWGPYSPHYSIAEAELEGSSELDLDANAIREGLKGLENLALADAG